MADEMGEKEPKVLSGFESVNAASDALSRAESSIQEALKSPLSVEQKTYFKGVKMNLQGADRWVKLGALTFEVSLAIRVLTACSPAIVGPVAIIDGENHPTATESSPIQTPTKTQPPTITPTKTEAPTSTATSTPTETPTPEFELITLINTDGEEITMPEFQDYNEAFIYISKNVLWHTGGGSDSTRVKNCDRWSKTTPKGTHSYSSIKKIPGWKPIFGGAKPQHSEDFFCYTVYKVEAGTLVKYETDKSDTNYELILVNKDYQSSNMQEILNLDVPTLQP